MRAQVLVKNGKPERAFALRELDSPPLKPGSVRIQVQTFGLNFADVLARLGLYPEAPALPAVLGYEVVGRISEIGEGVKTFKVGDRVASFTRFGGYADEVVVPNGWAVSIPAGLSPILATSMVTQYCTAYYSAQVLVNLMPGDRVLIHAAAGGVGSALVQLAKRKGCEIFGTAGGEEKLKYLRSLGVDHPIDYRRQDFKKECRRLSEHPLDVIFDSIGGATAKKGLSLLGAGGRLVLYGVADLAGQKKSLWRGLKTITQFGLIHPISLLSNSKSVLGVNMLRIADSKVSVLQRCLREVSRLVTNDELRSEGKIFPVSQLAQAHEYLGMRRSIGKVAVEWDH